MTFDLDPAARRARVVRARTESGATGAAEVPRHPLLRLQQQAGNAAVARLVQRLRQPDVSRETAGPEEEELQMKRDPGLQRQTAGQEEDELQMKHDPALQRAGDGSGAGAAATVGPAGGELDEGLAGQINSLRGAGSSLSDSVRSRAEGALGMDLSAVRVHQNAESDAIARNLTAKAFTTGADVFLRSDMNPNDSQLMGHELTHVAQQSGGAAAASGQRMTVGAADDPLEMEADGLGEAISRGAPGLGLEA